MKAEEKARDYINKCDIDTGIGHINLYVHDIKQAFITGAEWQAEQFPIDAIKNCLEYCKKSAIYDKLGYHGDFYYRMKKWIDEQIEK